MSVQHHRLALLTLLVASSAQAAFHLWGINEIYSNSTGSLQFIELKDTFGGQNFVGNQVIQATDTTGTLTHTFTLSSANLSGSTLNHSLLFGTAGVHAAGAPTPDYILPDNFLFIGGGTISFFGLNGGAYAALSTDGIHSRTWTGGDAINSPTNFRGETGTITPAPTTMGTVALAAALTSRRRRRAK